MINNNNNEVTYVWTCSGLSSFGKTVTERPLESVARDMEPNAGLSAAVSAVNDVLTVTSVQLALRNLEGDAFAAHIDDLITGFQSLVAGPPSRERFTNLFKTSLAQWNTLTRTVLGW